MSGRSLVSKRCVTVQLVDPCRLCHQRVPSKHTNSSKQSHRQPTGLSASEERTWPNETLLKNCNKEVLTVVGGSGGRAVRATGGAVARVTAERVAHAHGSGATAGCGAGGHRGGSSAARAANRRGRH